MVNTYNRIMLTLLLKFLQVRHWRWQRRLYLINNHSESESVDPPGLGLVWIGQNKF